MIKGEKRVEIKIFDREQTRVITVIGSIDSLTAPEITRFMLDQISQQWSNLILDLSQVDFMSSAGLRMILMVLKECRQLGGDLRLVGPKPGIERVLQITSFTSLLKIYPNLKEAVNSFAAVP